MLPSELLISPTLSLDSLAIAGEDHSFTVYFHNIRSRVLVATGSILPQYIFTYSFPDNLLSHAYLQFQRLSNQVDIRFDAVSDPDFADLLFFEFEKNSRIFEFQNSKISLPQSYCFRRPIPFDSRNILGRFPSF